MAEISTGSEKTGLTIRAHFRSLAAFLLILVGVSVVVGVALLSSNYRMVIFAQKDKPDFMQIFFPVDNAYSEQNSLRTAQYQVAGRGLAVTLPAAPVDHVRIDPANEASEIIIKRIEVRGGGGTVTMGPNELIGAITPINMIDKIEIVPQGLLIHSNGNDPAFELVLERPSGSSRILIFLVASLVLSALIFGAGKKILFSELSEVHEKTFVFIVPLVAATGIALLFYPGFMSYDTLHALRGARNGVLDSMWPPMVSYVWRVVDMVSLNPSAMHFSQIFLLFMSVTLIIFYHTKKVKYAAGFLLLYLSVPVVLGTVAVIWKDVLMAAFLLAGYAVVIYVRRLESQRWFALMICLAVFLVFLGVCTRHNAITAAVPLFFLVGLVISSRYFKSPLHLWGGVVLLGVFLTGTVFATKIQLDKYSLPNFEKLETSDAVFLRTVRVLDIAGASVCVGHNLFDDLAPDLTLDEIDKLYDPKHINLSKGIIERVGIGSRVDNVWLNVAIQHPICFLNNKFQVTRYLIGANGGDQFLITHPYVDSNEFGYMLESSVLRDMAVKYITGASSLSFFRPWFIYIIATATFLYLLRRKALTAEELTMFSSGAFYFGGLVIFGNATDARLLFYTTTVLLIFTFISIHRIRKRQK